MLHADLRQQRARAHGTPITTEVVNETCDPGSNSCIPIVELDGGVPTCPELADGGGTTGGTGGASTDCAVGRSRRRWLASPH